jgi:hypothetical protein
MTVGSAFGIWLFATLAANAQSANSIASCAWSKLPAEVRQDYLAAYAGTGKTTTPPAQQTMLNTAAVAACAGMNDIPPTLVQIAVFSQALEHGSARKLESIAGISPGALEAAWAKAPPDAVQCNVAKAADLYGLSSEPCADRKALFWFVRALNISSPSSNYPTVDQALTYFGAKGQAQLAEELITKFKNEKR